MLKRKAHASIAAVKSSGRQPDTTVLMPVRADDSNEYALLINLRHLITVPALEGRWSGFGLELLWGE
ncbi:hypothetical protein [Streptomyces sp. NPDC005004]